MRTTWQRGDEARVRVSSRPGEMMWGMRIDLTLWLDDHRKMSSKKKLSSIPYLLLCRTEVLLAAGTG
eukprot:307128-Hanusia_phi.AAC.4